jgi:pimeloyl-ACP methyl ester carboxylesterase
MDEVTASLRHRLASDGVFEDYGKVVFVCHSMGGIVAQELLLTHRRYGKQVPLIYFFATPQTGAQIANLGRAFSGNPLLEQLRSNDNYYLANLERQWRAADELSGIRRYCAYETIKTKGVLVVDNLSGTRACQNDALPIARNHADIVKPCSDRDDAYTALRAAIHASGRPADKEFAGLLSHLVQALREQPQADKRRERIELDSARATELSRFRVLEEAKGPTWLAVAREICARNQCLSCAIDEKTRVATIGVHGSLKKCDSFFVCPNDSCSRQAGPKRWPSSEEARAAAEPGRQLGSFDGLGLLGQRRSASSCRQTGRTVARVRRFRPS